VSGKMNALISLKQLKQETENYIKTVSGGTLTAWMKGKKLYITDEKMVMSKSQSLM
jgi:hypothetical protein